MLIFDESYMGLKSKYIAALSQYRVTYSALGSNSVKRTLRNINTQFTVEENQRYEFVLPENKVLPALLNDIWLLYIRMLYQKNAACYNYTVSSNYCPNWSLVTDYYYAFFCAATLLRLTFRGTFYFNQKEKREIDQILSEVNGETLYVPQNAKYYIDKNENENEAVIVLEKADKMTHELVWFETAAVLRQMRDSTAPENRKKAEYTVLTCLLKVLDVLQDNFPSQLRNAVNYQPQYGLKALKKDIFPPQLCLHTEEERWLEPVLSFDAHRSGAQVQEAERIQLFRAYAIYLEHLVNNLIWEYNDMQSRGNSLNKILARAGLDRFAFPNANYWYG